MSKVAKPSIHTPLLRVALPVPLYREFDYLPIAEEPLPNIGSRVKVSFGRQTLIGLVVAHVDSEDSDVSRTKLKTIQVCIDDEPILDAKMLKFARWLARYYHYPFGDVLSVMLPTLIRQGKPLDFLVTHWRIATDVTDDDFHANAYKQKQQFAMLKLHGEHGASEEVLLFEGMTRPFLKKLADKGLIERFEQLPELPKPASLAKMPLDLNEEQAQAVALIRGAIEAQKYTGFLINGVTGSGKTEVYLQAMQTVLETGKQVLVLVPEIGLTPQTKARFAQRFAARILLLHSNLSDTDRLRGWQDCRMGHAQIIIGTRSSVLYPYANLGMIIVDEAHDLSYKQQDSLRYQAGDVALYRGHEMGIPVVLGSATPSLEHLKLVQDNKLTELKLTKRAGHALPPVFKLIDARHSDMATSHSPVPSQPKTFAQNADHRHNNPSSKQPSKQPSLNLPSLNLAPNSPSSPNSKPLNSDNYTGLTTQVITAIHQTLEAGEQVLIFLNRRGYAPILLCEACGWQADCPRCDAHLTVHQSQLQSNQPKYMACHHCGWQTSVPSDCPECGSGNLNTRGIGTTKLSESLHAIFSNPQTSEHTYPILQIDRDTTRRRDSWQKLYKQINTGEPAILVGTQMLAKGHHFPNVTLVCMLGADRGFLSADFRSPEHTAQLIMQVAGRAGRGSKAGQVLIQTLQPHNPLLLKLVQEGYEAFADELMNERQKMGLPPFTHSALIKCEGKSPERLHHALQTALNLLPPNQLAILGPVDAPMHRQNSRYHSQILLLSKDRSHLHQVLNRWWQKVIAMPERKYLRLTLDVDAVGW